MNRREWLRRVRNALSPARFRHSVSVARLSKALAQKHGWDPELAWLAGLLHDWAKEWRPKDLIAYVRKNKIKVPHLHFIIRHAPNVLHAYVGAHNVRRHGWVKDGKALKAISSHTLGRVPMSLEEKILYVADLASPDRPYSKLREIRRLAFRQLDAAFVKSMAIKIDHNLHRHRPIHPLTIDVWNHVKE